MSFYLLVFYLSLFFHSIITTDVEPSYEDQFLLPDTIKYKVSLHFSTMDNSDPQESVDFVCDKITFHCTLPTQEQKLNSFFYNDHPSLSEEQMEYLQKMFSPLESTCFFQMVTTTGKEYLYEFCYDELLKRGEVSTQDEFHSGVSQRATKGVFWKNVETLGEAPDDQWWGVVEGDEIALQFTGYSTYFYQHYGDHLEMQFHCSEKPAFYYIYEKSFGNFVAACGSPLICTHPLVQRIRSNTPTINCYLASSTASKVEFEGEWKIFDGGEKYQYTGSVLFNLLDEIHDWGDFSPAIDDNLPPPNLLHIGWTLHTSESYQGIGLYDSEELCGVWTTRDPSFLPGIAFFRIQSKGLLNGFWWSLDEYGLEEMIPLKQRTENDDTDLLHNNYAVVRSFFDGVDYSSVIGNCIIRYSPLFDTYKIIWEYPDFTLVGKGIRTENHLCVVWREEMVDETGALYSLFPNDGVVHYIFEADRAKGFWTLASGGSIQKEDIIRLS